MKVRVGDHGGFFSDILDLAFANNFDAAAMPGINGCFCAREYVGLLLSELRAEKLSST